MLKKKAKTRYKMALEAYERSHLVALNRKNQELLKVKERAILRLKKMKGIAGDLVRMMINRGKRVAMYTQIDYQHADDSCKRYNRSVEKANWLFLRSMAN